MDCVDARRTNTRTRKSRIVVVSDVSCSDEDYVPDREGSAESDGGAVSPSGDLSTPAGNTRGRRIGHVTCNSSSSIEKESKTDRKSRVAVPWVC